MPINAVDITDFNATVGLDTSSVFIQSLWTLPFAQYLTFILLHASPLERGDIP